MKIAFDAKRAYQNETGLGHYSRTLITSLATYFPQHEYYLAVPKITDRFNTLAHKNLYNITPQGFVATKLKSLWRSNWVTEDLKRNGMDVYHGLSNEIPLGINKTGIKSVVTIHDLIFERYPQQYNWMDVQIYRKKFKYACNNADRVIAISEQTKEDIVQFYGIPKEKVSTCYQSCNPLFTQPASEDEKKRVRTLYNLPDHFFLYVGSIIERKDLLSVCKALNELKGKLDTPLVVIGSGGNYKQQVKEYIAVNNLSAQVIFLSESPSAQVPNFKNSYDFPAIYQLATCLVYPSIFEGFGIPILEALWSKTPVITTNVSCMPETGGDAALYVNPGDVSAIAAGLLKVSTDAALRESMKAKGWEQAQNFTPEKCASEVMQVYLRLK